VERTLLSVAFDVDVDFAVDVFAECAARGGGDASPVLVPVGFLRLPYRGDFLVRLFFFFAGACRIAVASRLKFSSATGPSVYSGCFIFGV
jgi:hypothetical protein